MKNGSNISSIMTNHIHTATHSEASSLGGKSDDDYCRPEETSNIDSSILNNLKSR